MTAARTRRTVPLLPPWERFVRPWEKVIPQFQAWWAVAHALDEMRRRSGARDRTKALDRETLRVVLPLLGGLVPDQVAATHALALRDYLQASGRANRTVNIRIQHMRALYRAGVKAGVLGSNPFESVPYLNEPESEIRYLTIDEQRRLVDACDQSRWSGFRTYVMTLLALDTALRPGELIQLTPEDLHLPVRTRGEQLWVKVRSQTSRVKRQRLVPLSPETADLMKVYLTRRAALRPKTGALWVTDEGTATHPWVFARCLARAGRRAGISRVTPHMLRHSFARYWLLELRWPEKRLAERLGHAEGSQVIRRYARAFAADLALLQAEASPAAAILRGLRGR